MLYKGFHLGDRYVAKQVPTSEVDCAFPSARSKQTKVVLDGENSEEPSVECWISSVCRGAHVIHGTAVAVCLGITNRTSEAVQPMNDYITNLDALPLRISARG